MSEDLEILARFFALLGDGRTKYGRRVRDYLDGVDDLDDMPTVRRALEDVSGKIKQANACE